jgi:hypothetical protein
MASHVIDGQSGAEVVGPDGRILAGNAVVVDPAWRPATAAAAMMAASPDTSNTDYLRRTVRLDARDGIEYQ